MGWLRRGGERITRSVHKNFLKSKLESKFVRNTIFAPFLTSLPHSSSSPPSMSILLEKQESDTLADSWSSYDSKNAPVCPCFKFNGSTVPELVSCPPSSHKLLAQFYPLSPREQDGPVSVKEHLSQGGQWL